MPPRAGQLDADAALIERGLLASTTRQYGLGAAGIRANGRPAREIVTLLEMPPQHELADHSLDVAVLAQDVERDIACVAAEQENPPTSKLQIVDLDGIEKVGRTGPPSARIWSRLGKELNRSPASPDRTRNMPHLPSLRMQATG